MHDELAECGRLSERLAQIGAQLDRYLEFEYPDAMHSAASWRTALGGELPQRGIGMDALVEQMSRHLIPNASQIPKPGCTSFITTGASSAGTLATLCGAVASPQRIGLTAFNFLEEVSLRWLAEMFELPRAMAGLYSSGGSVANLVALGAARQSAFERIGLDPGADGIMRRCRIYASSSSHRTIHRAAAVLGMGRNSLVTIPVDSGGRLCTAALRRQLQEDAQGSDLPVAIVANAGSTSTGAIDPLQDIAELAEAFGIWFHVDGAYGLPGVLDPGVRPLYRGLERADSVIVDPHKWLGAPVGIGATFVRDRNLLLRAFTQGHSDYLEGSISEDSMEHSMDSLGIPYYDYGVELSAPARGAVVWALIREIGVEGMRQRICRHNAMARYVAEQAQRLPELELLQQPTLSICCFRFVSPAVSDLNALNRRIHRQLVHNSRNIPSTAMIGDALAIRPCFVGARTGWQQAVDLVEEVIAVGRRIVAQQGEGAASRKTS